MTYFHVSISDDSAPDKLRCVLVDLSEAELKKSFVRPFRNGKNLLFGNELVSVGRIRKVKITATDEKSAVVIDRYERSSNEATDKLNRESHGLVFIGAISFSKDSLSRIGEDVTAQYITKAPNSVAMPSLMSRVANHPWMIAVIGGVIVLGIGALLKWN